MRYEGGPMNGLVCRSLRDVNAKTNVNARAIIHSILPDNGLKQPTVLLKSAWMLSSKIISKRATLEIHQINISMWVELGAQATWELVSIRGQLANGKTTNRNINISYIWGMKVVQWTISYAPGGRSLRDVNAKTKVTPRAIIYRIPPDKAPK